MRGQYPARTRCLSNDKDSRAKAQGSLPLSCDAACRRNRPTHNPIGDPLASLVLTPKVMAGLLRLLFPPSLLRSRPYWWAGNKVDLISRGSPSNLCQPEECIIYKLSGNSEERGAFIYAKNHISACVCMCLSLPYKHL